jgi:hypothetical protein
MSKGPLLKKARVTIDLNLRTLGGIGEITLNAKYMANGKEETLVEISRQDSRMISEKRYALMLEDMKKSPIKLFASLRKPMKGYKRGDTR